MKRLSRRESNWTMLAMSRPESLLWADTRLESGLVGGGDAMATGTRSLPQSRGGAVGSLLAAGRGRK